MLKLRFAAFMAASILAAAAVAQPGPGFDPEACAKHCREMAAARQKAMDACKARMDERQAAWKEVQAALDAARTARGDKKIAALESAVQKLAALHASEPGAMAGMADCPMMGGPGHGPRHMAGGAMGGCCAGATGHCCGGSPSGHHTRCPMMTDDSAPSKPAS